MGFRSALSSHQPAYHTVGLTGGDISLFFMSMSVFNLQMRILLLLEVEVVVVLPEYLGNVRKAALNA